MPLTGISYPVRMRLRALVILASHAGNRSGVEPFAGILQRFEAQATENFRAVNGADDEIYDYEAEQERKYGPYVEGEYPGESI